MKKEKTILQRIESLEAGLLDLKGWLLKKEFENPITAKVRFVEIKDKKVIKKILDNVSKTDLLEVTTKKKK